MVSTVASRANHYETLGVAPSASQEQIRHAFAARMFAPRPMADAAQVGIAYEVLRNPAKRKAYDDALGFNQPAVAPPLPAAVSFRISTRVVGAAPEAPVKAETVERLTAPEPHVEAPVRAVERPLGSFIAQSLRSPGALPPEPRPEPEAVAPRPAAPVIAPPVHALPEDDVGESGWNRTALAIGGVVLAVVGLGAWAGLEAGNPGEPGEAEAAVSAPLPKPKPATDAVAAPAVAEPAVQRAEPVTFAGLRTRHMRPSSRSSPSADRLAEVSQSLHKYYETTGADGTPEIAVADAPAAAAAPADIAPAAAATPASMPLSDRQVARTLDRIGYRCGQVVGTSPAEGEASGVFKVACSSGQSYQAKPVRGRYRFSRLKGD
jgi:hypothetical protein